MTVGQVVGFVLLLTCGVVGSVGAVWTGHSPIYGFLLGASVLAFLVYLALVVLVLAIEFFRPPFPRCQGGACSGRLHYVRIASARHRCRCGDTYVWLDFGSSPITMGTRLGRLLPDGRVRPYQVRVGGLKWAVFGKWVPDSGDVTDPPDGPIPSA